MPRPPTPAPPGPPDLTAAADGSPEEPDGRGPLGRRPTMRDVADAAGVGLATVSRVVNGGPVREDTATQVRQAIARLGFRRDEIARSLRPGQNSLTLGLTLGDLTNPFWSHLAKGAVEEARSAGYAVLVGTADEDPAGERRTIEDLVSRRVAGLIVAPGPGDHRYLAPERHGPRTPVVFVDRPARGLEADVVAVDNERGGRLATAHLIAHGHRRIAIVVAASYYTTGLRLRGYRRALRAAGLPVDEALEIRLPHGSVAEAADAARRLAALPDPPTAIFATTNFLTEGVLSALGPDYGRTALIGFDDFSFAGLLPTPVSVVAADSEQLGRRSIRLLLERIAGSREPYRREIEPVSLIARGSGEVPPAALPGRTADR
ncbi:LacI family transcriptional regulator [Friedmanniella endophytica]|uniref:LacI family transcriptional regulator n=1 Tax=Microlunatus kandeliicorticis TaxID=1759536 RepID=A0A7W3P5L4_9ACTN|nr:LacI family DNA-binding transcriptional regulator [Microlunatus kandeliicorticis]MBA8793992.1 LacI family transcriptional regulator [Microlunatus kandeliicorticis]